MPSPFLRAGLGVVLTLAALGCRQELPNAPPAPPIPTTSAPTTSPASAPATSTSQSPAPSASAPDPSTSTGGSVADVVITGRVKAELLKASDGKNVEINVETQNGVVRLTGVARSNSDIDSAVEIARRVEGVKEVQHKLMVKPG